MPVHRVPEPSGKAAVPVSCSKTVHRPRRTAGSVGSGSMRVGAPEARSGGSSVEREMVAAGRELTGCADTLAAEQDSGTAFLTLFAELVGAGATHRGPAEALAGAGFDIDAAAVAARCDVSGRLRELLAAAQRAGAIRSEITYADVKALMSGCLAYPGEDSRRVIDGVCRGLPPTDRPAGARTIQ
ncbi:TetR/AcrR family transcriptional regulator [Nocardia sp. ET3-3]|uniref:TetR/AcrR family transcriptional regulator n=1 Tax=Nocardia terrae TaxID=2675851 RepID=A0A7K1UPK2_9NOCA|nr:TetR/AcrR family transcriptional regulator [Nocardia terrae]MVU76273.1 TetR/AcrR family transcriptional regulator [Nocardia terrae]